MTGFVGCGGVQALGQQLCRFLGGIFQGRDSAIPKDRCETTLRHARPTLENIMWQITREEFGELLVTKRQWAQGKRAARYRCTGKRGTTLLLDAYQHLLRGGHPPVGFAASTTVFIPNVKDVDANGRLVRPPDALRPRTLRTCHCKIFTMEMCCGLREYSQECVHPSRRCVKEDHGRQHF